MITTVVSHFYYGDTIVHNKWWGCPLSIIQNRYFVWKLRIYKQSFYWKGEEEEEESEI